MGGGEHVRSNLGIDVTNGVYVRFRPWRLPSRTIGTPFHRNQEFLIVGLIPFMKRSHEGKRSDKTKEDAVSPAIKRPKSIQACTSCRRHKTRCEQLDGAVSGSLRCHRCKVLNMRCSFDNQNAAPVASASTPRKESPLRPDTACQIIDDMHTKLSPRNPSPSEHGSERGIRARNLQPEDLVHTLDKPWGFLKVPGGFDWTATPMLALQELALRSRHKETQTVDNWDISLHGIIADVQMNQLLEMYVGSSTALWYKISYTVEFAALMYDITRG